MELKDAFKRQHHLGLSMLRQCVERCPDNLWESGTHPRSFWRISYHAAYYTHLYLHPSLNSFVPWKEHQEKLNHLWGRPPNAPALRKESILEYISEVDRFVDSAVDALNLEQQTSGFPLYKMPKAELLMINMRHLQGHIGQLSELLMAEEIEIEWAGMN